MADATNKQGIIMPKPADEVLEGQKTTQQVATQQARLAGIPQLRKDMQEGQETQQRQMTQLFGTATQMFADAIRKDPTAKAEFKNYQLNTLTEMV